MSSSCRTERACVRIYCSVCNGHNRQSRDTPLGTIPPHHPLPPPRTHRDVSWYALAQVRARHRVAVGEFTGGHVTRTRLTTLAREVAAFAPAANWGVGGGGACESVSVYVSVCVCVCDCNCVRVMISVSVFLCVCAFVYVCVSSVMGQAATARTG